MAQAAHGRASLTCLARAGLAALALAGCAEDDLHEANGPEPGLGAEAHVLAQICLPDQRLELRTLDVDLGNLPAANRGEGSNRSTVWSAEQVAAADRQVRVVDPPMPMSRLEPVGLSVMSVDRANGLYSAGTAVLMLAGRTLAGQPVLENFAHRPAATIAFEVSVGPGDERIDYWFTLPKTPLDATFTAWLRPVSQEDAAIRGRDAFDTWMRLAQGEPLRLHPVTATSTPRMRFRLQTNSEHGAEQKRFLPAAFAARAQVLHGRVPAGTPDDPLPIVVPASQGAVPPC